MTESAAPEPQPSVPERDVDLGGGAGNDLKPATLALLLLLIGIGVAASVKGWEPRAGSSTAARKAVDLAPPAWWAKGKELRAMNAAAAARRADATKLDRTSKGLQALMKAYQAYNAMDLETGGNRDSHRLRDAYADYQARAREYFRFKGEKAFLALGQALLDDVWKALKTRDKKAVEALTGGFVPQALTIGLMRGQYQPTRQATPVINAAFLLRWVSVLADERPVDNLVAPEERLVLLRFKVGAHRTLPPERRMALGRLLRKVQPDFPTDELLAARFAAERQWSLAARFYRRALKGRDSDERLRANVAYCDDQARLYEKATKRRKNAAP